MSATQQAKDESHQPVWQELDSLYIRETLDLYRSEYLNLEAAWWDGSRIQGRFRLGHNPFTNPAFRKYHGDYLPASMFMVYLSQLGFVLARLLSDTGQLPGGLRLSTEEFFRARNTGRMVIVGLDNVRFTRRIMLSQGYTTLEMALGKSVRTDQAIIGRLLFSLDGNAFTGRAAIAFDLS